MAGGDASHSAAAAVQAIYDRRASGYDDSWHPSFAEALVACLPAPLPPGATALDLACGTGLVTLLLAASAGPGGRVVGLDISRGMLDVARQKLRRAPPEVAAAVRLVEHSIDDLGTAGELEGLEGRVDLITCASALVLLQDPGAALAGWARYLKRGTGLLVVDALPSGCQPAGLALERAARRLGLDFPYSRSWMVDGASLRDAVERSGELAVERVEFVRQTGLEPRLSDGGAGEAAETLGRLVGPGGHLHQWHQSLDRDLQGGVRGAFLAEWAALANEHGMVEDRDGVFVAVARRR